MGKNINQKDFSTKKSCLALKCLIKIFPFLFPLLLSSCISMPENLDPVPFPNIMVYQGATRFTFGKTPTQFITSVPDEKGGRLSIKQIHSTAYLTVDVLLFTCTLEDYPDQARLYKYDYQQEESIFLAFIYQKAPTLYTGYSMFSPVFVLDGENEESPCFGFLDEDFKVKTLPGGYTPYWVGKGCYLAGLTFEEVIQNYSLRADNWIHRMRVYYEDGTTVDLPLGIKRFFCDGTDFVYYAGSHLYKYLKGSGETMDLGVCEPVSPGKTSDFHSPSSTVGNNNPYFFRQLYDRDHLEMIEVQGATIIEKRIPFTDYPYIIEFLGLTNYMLICDGSFWDDHYFLQYDQETIKFVSEGYLSKELTACTIYSGTKYDLVENYVGSRSHSLDVVDKKTNEHIRVDKNTNGSFIYERIVEIG